MSGGGGVGGSDARRIRPSNPMQHALPAGKRALRTLLIDNYDSYTYNLYQQLAVVNGQPPHVCRNDEEGGDIYAVLDKMGGMPDNIVISPGPGHPALLQDFGMCIKVLRELSETPILGVCLGHEGLALAHGAQVVRAPVPMHGRLSPVFHNNDPLFKVNSAKASLIGAVMDYSAGTEVAFRKLVAGEGRVVTTPQNLDDSDSAPGSNDSWFYDADSAPGSWHQSLDDSDSNSEEQ
ncbi:class I glutamine amidotransferase-like protein [Tribonema minus]|uniref:anthranilate synthase n=1 Tax=Tribonema minus TaxID=303371 RepID=A0A835YW09_9STRA|nr:class I glutamine amidotransferase-like protein [Tribonema minus]